MGKAILRCRRTGFTLIELSIVLVIIGLIVGGILVGQDLIKAAAVRATVAQIEKYNTAVNTFRGKYGYLPGDITAQPAAQFGFIARGPNPGQGDGNGVIESQWDATTSSGFSQINAETVAFWVDLSTAHLIEGGFNTATATNTSLANVTGAALGAWLPEAKLGGGNYIYVWSGGPGAPTHGVNGGGNGINYFGLSGVTEINGSAGGLLFSNPGLTVQQAYGIDKKMDDGLPQSGNVTAIYLGGPSSFRVSWAAGGGLQGTNSGFGSPLNDAITTTTPGSSITCYDNGNITGPQQYSVEQNGGSNVNCALSFRFQ